MDSRVAQLIADIQFETSAGAGLDASAVRADIIMLFEEVSSESDRVALLQTFCTTMSYLAEDMTRQGKPTAPLETARLAQMRIFLMQESSASGSIDHAEYVRVVEREVDAGRLPADNYIVEEAMSWRKPPSPDKPVQSGIEEEPKSMPIAQISWWRRTFGA